jgi:hypothetical protein
MVKDNLVKEVLLNGSILCLDFVNTIHDRINEPERDYWVTYVHLLQWALKAGIIRPGEYDVFLEHFESRPAAEYKTSERDSKAAGIALPDLSSAKFRVRRLQCRTWNLLMQSYQNVCRTSG